MRNSLPRRIEWRRIDWRRIAWRTLPWGKIVGAALGLTAGVFGMVFGVIVGHLVDELLWTYVMRRLLRRYARTGTVPPELEPAAVPLAILSVVMGEIACDGHPHVAARAAPALEYLIDRYGTTARRRRTFHLATEEFRTTEGVYGEEPFVARLQAALSPHERAEVVWLAGRVARDAGSCARTAAEDLAHCLGVDPDIVADAARTEGELDERACMLLGVPQDADKEQIRRAYRRLAAEFHPDATRDLEPHQRRQAQEAFIRIREAYEKLMRSL
jgi:hypothetical protein